MNRTTITAIVVTMVVTGPGSAIAQESEAIQRIRAKVVAGDTISVLDATGGRVVGTYLDATDTTLKVQGTSINANHIARVTIKDSTRNGTLIGAAVGGAAGVVGALLMGSLCANEGSDCAGPVLGIMAAGLGAGAGIGWLGDRFTQREVYRREGTPREFSPEARVRFGLEKRSTADPVVGFAWSTSTESGLGIEVNVDATRSGAGGSRQGHSFDGRVLYSMGRGRIRPYVSGGAGYFTYYETVSYYAPPSRFNPDGFTDTYDASVHGVSPIVGGGVRIQPTRHLVIRPELSWFARPGNAIDGSRGSLRFGASVGATW